LEAKPDTNFCASELHFGHTAGLSASLKGRINSNSILHLVQMYSYIGICYPLSPNSPGWAGVLTDEEAAYIASQLRVNRGLRQSWEVKEFKKATKRQHLKLCAAVVKELSAWWEKRASVGLQIPLPEKRGRFVASQTKKVSAPRSKDTTQKDTARSPYWLDGTGIFICDGWGWGLNKKLETVCLGREADILIFDSVLWDELHNEDYLDSPGRWSSGSDSVERTSHVS
jgi:hypothetical protein